MSQEGGQMKEPLAGIQTCAIPAKQGTHGERMPQAMGAGRGHSWWRLEAELRHQLMEDLANRLRAYAFPFGKREHRTISIKGSLSVAVLQVLTQFLSHTRPERNQTALGELGVSDHEKPPVEVYVAPAQAGNFPYAQPEGNGRDTL